MIPHLINELESREDVAIDPAVEQTQQHGFQTVPEGGNGFPIQARAPVDSKRTGFDFWSRRKRQALVMKPAAPFCYVGWKALISPSPTSKWTFPRHGMYKLVIESLRPASGHSDRVLLKRLYKVLAVIAWIFHQRHPNSHICSNFTFFPPVYKELKIAWVWSYPCHVQSRRWWKLDWTDSASVVQDKMRIRVRQLFSCVLQQPLLQRSDFVAANLSRTCKPAANLGGIGRR